jgi:hypothetical protein
MHQGRTASRRSQRSARFLQFESSGRSTGRQLVFSLRGDLRKQVSLYGYYTLGWARSDTDGASTTAADADDRASEFGFASTDERHQVSIGASVPMPAGISLSGTLSLTSGQPFNIITGRDNNGDTIFVDRPAFASAGDAGAIVTPFGVFAASPGPGARIVPRNFGRGRGQVDLSLHASKSVVRGLVVSASANNVLNRTNLSGFNGVVTSPVFRRGKTRARIRAGCNSISDSRSDAEHRRQRHDCRRSASGRRDLGRAAVRARPAGTRSPRVLAWSP